MAFYINSDCFSAVDLLVYIILNLVQDSKIFNRLEYKKVKRTYGIFITNTLQSSQMKSSGSRLE